MTLAPRLARRLLMSEASGYRHGRATVAASTATTTTRAAGAALPARRTSRPRP